MKNYTTQTAALKATTVDTRLLDAKILKVNGENIKEISINNYVRVYNVSDVYVDGTLFTNFVTDGLTSSIGDEACTFRINNVKIKGKHITCPIYYEVGNAFIQLWEQGDDLTQIYGGLTSDSKIEVVFTIVKESDIPLQ